jgi:hypothetical protein
MKINFMNKHYHIINDIIPKIREEIVNKLNNKDARRYIINGSYVGRIIKDPSWFSYGKGINVFRIWYDSITFTYNCAFTDEYYEDIIPILDGYKDILDDIFVYNVGEEGKL